MAGKIDFRRVSLVAFFDADDDPQTAPSSTSSSLRLEIAIFFDPSSDKAFFKLRAPVVLRHVPSQTGDLKCSVHLLIRPEHVASIALDRSSTLPETLTQAYKKLAGRHTTCLRFTLTEPASLVVPDVGRLFPKTVADAEVLGSLQVLARRRGLAVYILSEDLLGSGLDIAPLCEAASRAGQLTSSPQHANHQTLYRDLGARMVPLGEIGSIVAPEAPTESPPSYDELAPSPPPLHPQTGVRKRPRTGSSGPERSDKHSQEVLLKAIEAADEKFDQLRNLILEADKKNVELGKRLRQADETMTRLAGANIKSGAILEAKTDMDELKQNVDKRLDRVRGEIHDLIESRLSSARLDINKYIDDQFDDHDVHLRTEMEDYVDASLAAVEDDLKEKLESSARLVFLD